MGEYENTIYNFLLRNYFRYDILREELATLLYRKAISYNSNAYCFIDLNSYLEGIFKSKNKNCIYDVRMSIVSSIINFAAHIVEFFNSRMNMGIKVFIVFGNYRPPYASELLPQYNAHFIQDINMELYNIVLDDELEQLANIVKYIPNVYFMKDMTEEPAVLIRYLMADHSILFKNDLRPARFVFTKDLFTFQLAACCPNTHIIRVKKSKYGDVTSRISYFDFYKKISKELSLSNPIGGGISPELYSLYLAYAGCKTKGVRSLRNFPNTDKFIKDLLVNQSIINSYNITLSTVPSMFESEELFNRFKGLDVMHRFNMYINSPSSRVLTSSIIDLYDPQGMQDLNNGYFKKYPLDLNVF